MRAVAIFLERGYCVLRSLVPARHVQALLDHALRVSRRRENRYGDRTVPGTPAIYSDPQMERLLAELAPTVEKTASVSVFPTYSYFRVYKHGDQLMKHRDRPACEISLTLTLGNDPDEPWPIWVDSGFGPRGVRLKQGDALMYRGTDVLHWRNVFPGNYAAQVFLHYVDQNGPNRKWRFDKRPGLGFQAAFNGRERRRSKTASIHMGH
jgi:hypothetical protein